ncbi:MAG: NADH-quinone oxidoreductase subunit L [Alphaproteobacteria bacterium]|nr:NADH-quinone oxidoreductase subunit L [Alphaproteobacteria bacterium]
MTTLSLLAVFSPFVACLMVGFGALYTRRRLAVAVTIAGMVAATVASYVLFLQQFTAPIETTMPLLQWFHVGDFTLNWALRLDTLSIVMFCVVNTVSLMVHVYSVGYMHHPEELPRFMSYLSLFTFAMLMLVSADNLVQLFFGWEGVGLASYLLIGFWFQRDSANKAAIKAFVVNRVGDVGFALGICFVFAFFGTVQFSEIFAQVETLDGAKTTFLGIEWAVADVMAMLLFIGAMGKSAQLGLHTWLPDAMEGPTPVSALIHAATMVTAGVFMVCRLSPLFEQADVARDIITYIGAATALFAATAALVQNDIKRVIAYSTCSQLGYMFMAAGLSFYSVSIFHLTTHAFFKALLFLSAGSVIHALQDEQDMRKMGGLRSMIPLTYFMMWVGSLALAGFPPFAGFYSKDAIIEAGYVVSNLPGTVGFYTGIFVAFLTALYSWRLIYMTFHGDVRASEKVFSHVNDAPLVMIIPLMVLAFGAVLSGVLLADYFIGESSHAFFGSSLFVAAERADLLERIHHVPKWVKWSPVVASALGLIIAYMLYARKTTMPQRIATQFRPIYLFFLNKWYFDELYDAVFVKPMKQFAKWIWQVFDTKIVDEGIPGTSSKTVALASRLSVYIQTGKLYHYAFAMVGGVLLLVFLLLQ